MRRTPGMQPPRDPPEPPDDPLDPRPPTIEELFVRDDLDATLRFFAAAEREPVSPGDSASLASHGEVTMLDLSRFRARRIRERMLALVEQLRMCIDRRDVQGVWDLLDETDALRCLPPAVREEALRIVRLPISVERAPLRLFRYQYTLLQLGDEPMPRAGDPDQIPMPLIADPPRSATRTLRFRARSDDGSDRRRSGGS